MSSGVDHQISLCVMHFGGRCNEISHAQWALNSHASS